MNRGKDLALSLLLSLVSIVVCLSAAEIVLRFLPVATGLRSMPVNAGNPVLRFSPDRPFVYSLGWNSLRQKVGISIRRGRPQNIAKRVRQKPVDLLRHASVPAA